MEQKEIFIINDVTLDINPSDIKLIEDNYVTQESFLRTKSVAAYRSKYAASKIILTIPVEINDIVLLQKEMAYKDLPDILKVIVQLDTYPFCFIKSSRVQTYISPTHISSTGFLMFAVDELNIHCKADFSNIIFLELSLIYFNHSSLVKDFKFKKTVNLETYEENENFKYTPDPVPLGQGVNSLNECLSWERYFSTVIKDLQTNLNKHDFKLGDVTPIVEIGALAVNGLFNSLRVQIGVPIVQTVDSTNYSTGLLATVGKNSKLVRSYSPDPNTALETILSQKEKGQIFTQPSENPDHPEFKPNDRPKSEELTFEQVMARTENPNAAKEFFSQSRLHIIDYVPVPLIEYKTIIQSLSYRKKNKLAINHIGSLKYPVIQYLGKYPTEIVLQFVSDCSNEYKDISEVGAAAALKEKLNIIDYNRLNYPEIIAYNNIKILSLPTFLTNNLYYLPNQFHINATAEEQGIETFTCTFVENNLKEFLLIGDVVNSGKNSGGLSAEFTHNVILKYISELAVAISDESKWRNLNTAEADFYKQLYVKLERLAFYILFEFGGPKPTDTGAYLNSQSSDNLGAKLIRNHNTVRGDAGLTFTYPYDQDLKKLKAILVGPNSIETVIRGRRQVVTGLLGQTPEKAKGMAFAETYEATTLIKELTGDISLGAAKGYPLCVQTTTGFDEELFDKIYESTYAFNGQAISDLQLERAGDNPLGYIEESDTHIQNVNPFFFIEEVKLIDPNVVKLIYEQITGVDDAIEQALGAEASDRKKSKKELDQNVEYIVNNQSIITDYSPAITDETAETYTKNTFTINQPLPAVYKEAIPLISPTIPLIPSKIPLIDGKIPLIPGTKKSYTDIRTDHNKELVKKYKPIFEQQTGISLTDDEWLIYCNTLGLLESTYSIGAVLNNTYYGKYQISLLSLRDLKFLDSRNNWINPPGYTMDKFLADADMQEKVFAMYTALNYKYMLGTLRQEKAENLLTSKSTREKLAILAAAHFGHTAGTAVLKGKDKQDGNGVSAKSRYDAIMAAFGMPVKSSPASNQTKSGVPATDKNATVNKETPPEQNTDIPTTVVKTRTITPAQLGVYSNVKERTSKDTIGTVLNPKQAPFNSSKTFTVSSGFGMRNGRPHNGIDIVIQGGNIDGQPITPAADGVVIGAFFDAKGGGGNTVIVQHNNLYKTGYCHLSEINCVVGDKIVAFKTVIGKVGGRKGAPGAGSSTGPHLHYSIKYENTFIDPLLILDLAASVGNTTANNADIRASQEGQQRVAAGWSQHTELDESYPVTVYDEAVWLDKFLKMTDRGVNKGLATAFPTIKVYVTVGNEDNDFLVGETGKIIEFYEVNGIRDFHLNTNNQFNPVDVVTMVIANPNFIRTDEMTLLSSRPSVDLNSIATDYSTQFKNNKMKLLPGMKLHIRMGYSNNPNHLDIVFNGSIVETSSITGSSVRVMAEGFGKELLSDILGVTAPQKLGGGWNGSTGTIFADLMTLPGIYHFGKTYSFLRMLVEQTNGDDIDPEAKSLLSGDTSVINLQNKYRDYSQSEDSPRLNLNYYLGFKILSNVTQRSRIYTNIYSADIEYVDNEFSSPFINLFANTLFNTFSRAITYDYFAVKETPWDVMRQMVYRHPGTIVKPLIYEDRCTLFFGIKEQMYIARDSDKYLMSSVVANYDNNEKVNPVADKYIEERIKRMEPAFNFHIINSEMNLVSNEIKLNGGFYTKVNVGYREDNDDISSVSDWDTFSMGIDDNISPWEIRTTDVVLSGCDHRYMAYRYGTCKIIEEAETMYEGKIFILGNSAVKSGDYAYIHDTTRRMFGIIKVRECIHHFDERNGFITEITPGLFVEPAEFVRSTLFLRLGLSSRILCQDNITTEIINNAFSQDTFQLVAQSLLIQNEFSKLARPGTENNLGGFDIMFEAIRDDPALVATSFLPPGLFALMAYQTYKATFAKTRFANLATMSSKAILGTTRRAAVVQALADSGRYLVNKLGAIRQIPAATMTVVNGVRLTNQIGAAAGIRGLELAKVYLGATRTMAPQVGMGLLKLGGQGLLRTGIIALRGSFLVLGLVGGPIGLAVTLVTQLVLNYAMAKIEEEHYTRQPVLLYPLVANGRPYVAGITGMVRNSYWNSLMLEGEKTLYALRKAATIINNKRLLSGKDDSIILNMLSYNNAAMNHRTTFAVNKDGMVTTDLYANGALMKRGGN